MATCNGQKHLDEQLKTIVSQSDVDVTLFIYDDASTDGTISLIENFETHISMQIESGVTRIGLPDVYLNLLNTPNDNFDMYAFADQDDVWSPTKLSAAWSELSLSSMEPFLWISGYNLLKDGAIMESKSPKHAVSPSLGNALVDGLGPGCAMVWNSAFHKVIRVPRAINCVMHDRWLYASATLMGSVFVDSRELMSYRIHGDNSIGLNNSLTSRIKRQVNQLAGHSPSFEAQASELSSLYQHILTPEQIFTLETFAHGRRFARVRMLMAGGLSRHTPKDQLLLLLRILILPNMERRRWLQ